MAVVTLHKPVSCTLRPLQYSLMYNLTPDKRGAFRAARTNFLFILLMLISLFLILLPIAYIIAK